ncbi:hypothetical protein [Parasitella parasitica]|uniref:Cyclin-dependent kinases regulatory subunit n=1 Tax=Parasitella parasitica TaxID=35722 RepID=A0A0B7NS53_9FUNG|nr:hypothetical protein [Parasitella parasitica]
MNNDENRPQCDDKNTSKNSTIAVKEAACNTPTAAAAAAAAKHEGTNLKEYNNLMPKTIDEIKEIQARGRKLLIRKKYIKRPRPGLPNQPQKSEEELKLEELQKEKDMKELPQHIVYSKYYSDDEFEYRHVVLPKNLARWLPQGQLLQPKQWIDFGVHQSTGWEHYMIYKPEPHILLFKREKDYLNKYGDHNPQYPPEIVKQIKLEQAQQKEQEQQQQQQQKNTENPDTKNSPPLLPAPAPLSLPPHHQHNFNK